MIEKIIEKYKNKKKQFFLDFPEKHKNQYAFAGVGSHSISNLYPVLSYLSVPLKMIYSRSLANAEKMAKRFSGAVGVNDIDSICKSPNINGVFICVKSEIHFELVKKCLEAGKHVFVDKPPCTSLKELEELIELEKEKKAICVVGLQRRYSKIYGLLSGKISKAISYNYNFYTGAYPEGNIIYDLFIHPIDILIYLFGAITEVKSNVVKNQKGLNISLLTKHDSGCCGTVDLSSMYSWQKIEENLRIVTPKSVFRAEYPVFLSETNLQGQIFGMPMEKVMPSKYSRQNIYYDNNYLNPVKEYNTLTYQGFFDEINTFVNLIENGKGENKSSLKQLNPVYDLIEKIEQNISR